MSHKTHNVTVTEQMGLCYIDSMHCSIASPYHSLPYSGCPLYQKYDQAECNIYRYKKQIKIVKSLPTTSITPQTFDQEIRHVLFQFKQVGFN